MRFPFLKLSSKRHTEPDDPPVTPPRVTISAPPPEAKQNSTVSVSPPNSETPTIPLRLGSILSQLPSQLFAAQNKNEHSSVTIAIPGHLVLPQLASGRITLTLADLVKVLPKELLRQPLTVPADQQQVVLPLSEIISSIPAETLAVQHDSVIATDTAEFNALPKLFDDSFLQEPTIAEEPAATEVEAVEGSPLPEAPILEAVRPVALPQSRTAATPDNGGETLPPNVPEQVTISLRSLIAVLPDRVFAGPRTDLWRKADFDSRVRIPVAPILPQLKTARLELPVSNLMALVPAGLLANPLPETGEETVRVPLEEIVPQLPASVFTAQFAQSEPLEFELADVDIPSPFQEKGAAADSLVPEIDVPAAEIPFEPAALEDVALDIFVEKPAPVEIPRVEPLEAISEPVSTVKEPVAPLNAEIPQAVEPVVVEAPKISETAVVPPSPVQPTPSRADDDTQLLPAFDREQVEPVAETTPIPADETPVLPEPVSEVVEPVTEAVQPVTEEVQPVTAEVQPVPSAEPVTESTAPVAPAGPPPTTETDPGNFDRFLVNLNRCAVEDLQTIEGIGPGLAKRIIEFRDARGHFSSLDELRQIPGIGRKTFRALTGVEPRALNRLLGADHNRELSLQEVVRLTSALPGITGCMLAMSNGLFLTGELPPQFDRETISVFAPQLFKKVGRYTRELRVGQIRRFTIFTDQQPLSIFRAGEVYLIVIHDTRHFSKALLRRCERISQEIARLCRQRAVV